MNALSQTWAAIWLPRLATDRLIRSGGAPKAQPIATYAKIGNAFELTCVSKRASELGLSVGTPLADARAMQPSLFVCEDDSAANARALVAIAAWCERFTPVVAVDASEGLFLDVTGCAHLFGGEEALHSELTTRLAAQGFTVRCAFAPTPGAAWALARYGASPFAQGNRDALFAALAPLTVNALRLELGSVALLKRLGLKTVAQLHHAPRASLAARAGEAALLRLDQALGKASEAISPRRPPPLVFALRRFLEPIFTTDAILDATRILARDALVKLDRRGAGLRRAELHLFGVDGRDRVIEIGLSRPERDEKAIVRLFRERLNVAPEQIDAEFGIEAARFDAVQTEIIDSRAQTLVAESETGASEEKISALVDVLSARLGGARVLRPRFHGAHTPERAAGWGMALHEGADKQAAPTPPEDGVQRRPLKLFRQAQPIEAISIAPDGPPVRFRWRRVLRDVVRAEGPERIAMGWMSGALTRDYYRVEDAKGRRYWLYREGLYGETDQPHWFVHGLFA
ncbi:MAG TPA: DNA polymerase Y family protein [Caulobacterales bacterium]|nr:DNA polymerase Y family protein [Caulobacterales bacterium]